MHKTVLVLLATAALTVPAAAQSGREGPPPGAYAAPVAGVAVGTTVGLGLAEGWWGASALPATAAGAAAVGGVAGIGTMVLIHSATTPCQGAHFMFGGFYGGAENSGCVNGHYVGYGPRSRVVERAVVRRRHY